MRNELALCLTLYRTSSIQEYMQISPATICTIFLYIIHNSYMFWPNLQLPEDGQDMWPKHVGAVYNKYENIVQLVGGEIFACITFNTIRISVIYVCHVCGYIVF